VEDDRHNVLENSPMSRHFTVREEELFKIGTVSFERLMTLLRQGVEGRLKNVVLIEVGSVIAEVSTFHTLNA
jgi:hypothetical protein